MDSNIHLDQDQLATQLKAKNKQAFSYLYDHYSAAVFGIISRIVIDENISEEVLHDAFLKFWEKIDQYDSSKGRLFTWMANISRNLAIDKLRSKELKKADKTDSMHTYVTDSIAGTKAFQNIDGIGLAEALKALREEERFVLEMTYFKGYTQSEITKEFDIPLGTVKTRLRMAMKSLRNVLRVE